MFSLSTRQPLLLGLGRGRLALCFRLGNRRLTFLLHLSCTLRLFVVLAFRLRLGSPLRLFLLCLSSLQPQPLDGLALCFHFG